MDSSLTTSCPFLLLVGRKRVWVAKLSNDPAMVFSIGSLSRIGNETNTCQPWKTQNSRWPNYVVGLVYRSVQFLSSTLIIAPWDNSTAKPQKPRIPGSPKVQSRADCQKDDWMWNVKGSLGIVKTGGPGSFLEVSYSLWRKYWQFMKYPRILMLILQQRNGWNQKNKNTILWK